MRLAGHGTSRLGALVLIDDIVIAGGPFLVSHYIPVLFGIGVIQESHNANIVLTPSIDVLQLLIRPLSFRIVGSLIALVVDIVHRSVRSVEDNTHLHPLFLTVCRVVVQCTNASELVPHLRCVKTSMVQKLVMVIRSLLGPESQTLVTVHARVSHH